MFILFCLLVIFVPITFIIIVIDILYPKWVLLFDDVS